MNTKPTIRDGFTLIELLVVVAIIVALIAILLPSMGRSIELAQRAVCLSNQSQAVTGCLTYAADYVGLLPPGAFDTNNDGVISGEPHASSFDYRAPSAGGPIGVGLLAKGYVSPGTFPGWVHCPSMDTSGANYTAQGHWSNTPYHSMDVNIPNWWGGVGASWWDDTAYNAHRVIGAYNYRAASWFNVNRQYLRVSSKNPGAPRVTLYSDILDTRFGINYTHREGYMQAFLDGGGHWYADTTLEIESLILASGDITFNAWVVPSKDEQVFDHMARNSGN